MREPGAVRLLAADQRPFALPDGTTWPGWRSGFYNMPGTGREYVSWSVQVPALPSLLGPLGLDLTVADITPSPWNQPPYAPSGHTATANCTTDVIPPSPTRQ